MRAELWTSLERVGRFPPFRPSRFSRSAVLAVALVLLLCAPALAFSDTAGHPYADAIDDLSSREIINGFEDGTFGPNKLVMRQQFAKMIVGTLGLSVQEGLASPFTDLGPNVANNLYPHEYVAVAHAHGITKGKTATSFAPYEEINRAQVITMVVRALEQRYPNLLADPPADFAPSWPDFSPDHAANAKKAEYNDLLIGLGRDDTHPRGNLAALDPWGNMPRSEVAQILATALSMIPRAPQATKVSPARTAELLADAATTEEGVWSLLANLGLGVYTAKAGQVMPGSERSAQDVFLFNFEVKSLVMAAGQVGPTTTELHEAFRAAGMDIPEAALLEALRNAYLEENDGEFLPELFRAMGVQFIPGEELTGLQAFLLYLDVLVPPNGSAEPALAAATYDGEQESFQHAVLAASQTNGVKSAAVCDVVQGFSDPAWGYARSYLETIAKKMGIPVPKLPNQDQLHALMMFYRSTVTLNAEPTTVHETCPEAKGVPDTSDITLTTDFYSRDIPRWLADCVKLAFGFDIPADGPMPNTGVRWSLDDVLQRHGDFNQVDGNGRDVGNHRVLTDEDGQAYLRYSAREEAAKGQGWKNVQQGTVEAIVEVQQADIFNKFAFLREIIQPKKARVPVTVEWHEQPWNLELRWRDLNEEGDLAYNWSFDLVVNEDGTISGSGTGSLYGYSILYPDGSRIKATTSADFEYRIDSTKARQESLGAGSAENHFLVFSPGAFIPTRQSLRLFAPGVTPEDEQNMAEITVDFINLLIEDIASLGELRVPMVDGASSYALVPGANEDQVYYTLAVGSGGQW